MIPEKVIISLLFELFQGKKIYLEHKGLIIALAIGVLVIYTYAGDG